MIQILLAWHMRTISSLTRTKFVMSRANKSTFAKHLKKEAKMIEGRSKKGNHSISLMKKEGKNEAKGTHSYKHFRTKSGKRGKWRNCSETTFTKTLHKLKPCKCIAFFFQRSKSLIFMASSRVLSFSPLRVTSRSFQSLLSAGRDGLKNIGRLKCAK